MKKLVTLKDIARETGLTMASVSRALRDMPDVADETKQYVHDVAENLGYHPNVFAASLRTGKSKFIGLIIPQNTNPYFATVMADVIAVVIENGYIPLVLNSLDSKVVEQEAVSAMISFRVAGVLTIPVSLKNFLNLPFPVVVLARQFEPEELEHFDYIINDERGMELSVKYLAQQKRKIYYFSGQQEIRASRVRRMAFEAAMKKCGVPLEEDTVIVCKSNDMQAGYQATIELLAKATLPIAVQCMSDHMALGVIKAIRDNHLKVPQDVAVIGHDDIVYCEYLPIPLSSISLSQELGKEAASFLFKKLEDGRRQMKIIAEPKLVIRESARW